MKVLNILSTGGVGGEEVLCKDIGLNSDCENTFCFLFGRGKIYEEMNESNLQTVDFSQVGGKISLKKLRKLVKLAKKFDIVVVHPGTFLAQTYFNLTAVFNRKLKYVLTVHSCFEKDTYYFKNPVKTLLRKYALKQALRTADKIVFVSNAGKESFIKEFSLVENKLEVIYNGISLSKIEQGKNNIPSLTDKISILYIGRLAKVKGVHLLIDAVAELKKKYDVDLVVVGDGEEKDELIMQTKRLGIERIVHFEGQQRKLDKYYKNANLFVYPSTWAEVFGISLVESMAYGLPCIANKVGGIPEILVDGYNGYLTDSPTSEGVREAIERYIKNGITCDLVNNCKSTALKFSISNTVKKQKEVYEDVFN